MALAFGSSSLIIPQHLNEADDSIVSVEAEDGRSSSSGMSFSVRVSAAFPMSKGRISLVSTGVSFTGSCRTIATKEKDRRFALVAQVKTSAEGDLLVKESSSADDKNGVGIVGVHHVGLLCKNLEKSLEFYQNLLGLEINEARPHNKLPYRGAWLWVGSEMIHLMELPNPDPLTGRPKHGGRDRHTCLGIRDVSKLKDIFDKAGITYTLSQSGRPAIFTRDPDGNALEFTQI